MITIKVPATSANLGSGFDELGLALQLYAEISVEFSDHYRTEGIEKAYIQDNLIQNAYEYTCLKEAYTIIPLFIKLNSAIPISRGLGSSASLIVGGVSAAFALHSHTTPKDKILEYATFLEGHPDNVAPAIFGELIQNSKNGQILQRPLHPSLIFSFLIPNFELSTSHSRSVLPKHIPDEIKTVHQKKLANLIEGLKEGNMHLIEDGCDDVIHQPYRFPLIQDYPQLKEILNQKGIHTLFLSGAGPSIGVITQVPFECDVSSLKAHWLLETLEVDSQGITITYD